MTYRRPSSARRRPNEEGFSRYQAHIAGTGVWIAVAFALLAAAPGAQADPIDDVLGPMISGSSASASGSGGPAASKPDNGDTASTPGGGHGHESAGKPDIRSARR